MMRLILTSILCLIPLGCAFGPPAAQTNLHFRHIPGSKLGSVTEIQANAEIEDDSEIQWDLFKKHHAKGEWKGVWTSYDYIGDVIDETVASVDLTYDGSTDTIEQVHKIVVGAKRSDCATCFDSFETKQIPVAKYSQDKLYKARLGSVGLVNGPSLLRSGSMSTELVLSWKDGRVRVIFQHAPVWKAGVEPGSGPPDALKLFRTMVSREALREQPPTAETESSNPPTGDNPVFFRGVPPFAWHKVWGGTSWTWGPSTGNRGWSIDEMEEVDAWHGRPTGDNPNVWNLRLPGGILLQAPRIVTDGEAGLCRLAWLPREDTLLRVEAGVLALEPMVMEDDTMVGFFPPSLGSLRVDVMRKTGELENASMLVQKGEEDGMRPRTEAEIESATIRKSDSTDSKDGSSDGSSDGDSGLDAVRAAIQL